MAKQKLPYVQHRGNGKWRYTLERGGKRNVFHFDAATKKAAQAEAARIRDEETTRFSSVTDARAATITIHEALDLYLAENFIDNPGGLRDAELKIRQIKRFLRPDYLMISFGDEELHQLKLARARDKTVRRVDGVLTKTNVTPATVNRMIEKLGHVFGFLKRTRRWKFPDEPMFATHKMDEPTKRVRELSPAEYQTLVAEMRPDYRALFDFSLLVGQRLTNTIFLRWKEVTIRYDDDGNLVGGHATVKAKSKGQFKKDHTFEIPAPACEIILAQRDDSGTPFHRDFVFTYRCVTRHDDCRRDERYPMTRTGFNGWWNRHVVACGIHDYRWHDNRHTCASHILAATGDLTLVQAQLGHSNIATTQRYAHTRSARVASAVEKAASAAPWGQAFVPPKPLRLVKSA